MRLRGEAWRASFTAFTGTYKDFISQQQVGGTFTPANPAVYRFVNLSRVKISGLEGRAQAELGGGVSLNFAAAYAKGDQTTNGVKAPLDSIDPIKVVAGLAWSDADDRFGGQLVATHTAGKKLSRAGGACGAACFTPPAFTILDATAFWRVTGAATLRAGLFNITDKKYWWWSDVRGLTTPSAVTDAYTQPGRNVGISLNLRL